MINIITLSYLDLQDMLYQNVNKMHIVEKFHDLKVTRGNHYRL